MPGLSGRVLSSGGGRVRIELSNSGQIVDVTSSERFFIGDPVLMASENGRIAGVKRVSEKVFVRQGGAAWPSGAGLGEYWERGK